MAVDVVPVQPSVTVDANAIATQAAVIKRQAKRTDDHFCQCHDPFWSVKSC